MKEIEDFMLVLETGEVTRESWEQIDAQASTSNFT